MTHHRRIHRRALGAIATSTLALGCLAAPAQAVDPSQGPPRGTITITVPDAKLPKRGCVTVTAKVRVDVEGELPWNVQNGASAEDFRAPGYRYVTTGDKAGTGDSRFGIKWRLCEHDVPGYWRGTAVLIVNGDSFGYTVASDSFHVRPAKK